MDSQNIYKSSQDIEEPGYSAKAKQLIDLFAQIILKFGYAEKVDKNEGQVQVFNTLVPTDNGMTSLAVTKNEKEKDIANSFNIHYHHYEGKATELNINGNVVKQIDAQIAASISQNYSLPNYRQCTIQIYLEKPQSYLHEDFIFQLRIDNDNGNPRIQVGAPWIDKKDQFNLDQAIKLMSEFSELIENLH